MDLGADHRRLARTVFRSGWRSARLEVLDIAGAADHVALPGIGAQLLDLQISGTRLVHSRRRGTWAAGLMGPGALATTAPSTACDLRWDSPTGDARITQIRLLLPERTMTRVAAEVWAHGPDRLPPPNGLAFDDEVLRAMLTRLHEAARAGVTDLYAASAAEFIAVHLLTRHGTAPAPPPQPRDDARVARAIDLLHASLNAPVSLAVLAAAAGLSRYHLLRLFRDRTGETPAQYHLRLRIELAARLLRTTSASVAEIAELCGFVDQSHFAKTFRRRTGTSPSAYRSAL
ncbi:helix-turn-helix domain-containing protein [Catenuloplanes japonicus]|uniref:helix-turn-helix domain-containing protein n=1 Tax=Catenuloplanes japonicus TaxID=33876 RepID=UPI00068A7F7E|nr:AraC family transcriptional regulator [Catenuloplanes japonicus]